VFFFNATEQNEFRWKLCLLHNISIRSLVLTSLRCSCSATWLAVTWTGSGGLCCRSCCDWSTVSRFSAGSRRPSSPSPLQIHAHNNFSYWNIVFLYIFASSLKVLHVVSFGLLRCAKHTVVKKNSMIYQGWRKYLYCSFALFNVFAILHMLCVVVILQQKASLFVTFYLGCSYPF
jgi:hypothetical protein